MSASKDKNFSTTQTEDNVLNLISSARESLENGDFEAAEQDLILGLAISNNMRNSTQLPYIYDILSAMAFSKGNLEKAASILEDAVKELILLGFPENHHHVTDFRFRLARIFSSLAKSESAEKSFENSLNQLRKELDIGNSVQHSSLLYANFLFRYGLYKLRHTEYDEAKEIINNALEHFKSDVFQHPSLIKPLSCTLTDLSSIIISDEKAVVDFADALPLLKIPECSKTSHHQTSSKESTLQK